MRIPLAETSDPAAVAVACRADMTIADRDDGALGWRNA
jgi:hypothetical protein